MALNLIEIKDFPKTTTLVGSGEEIFPVSKGDGKTYGIKSSDLKAFLGTVQSTPPRPIAPSDPAPTLDGVYEPVVDGTYANAGGLTRDTAPGGVDEGMAVQFIKNGSVWVKNTYPLPKTDLSSVVLKEDLGFAGVDIDITPYVQLDKRVNSLGVLQTITGAIAVVKMPFNKAGVEIGGWLDSAVRNYALYDSRGIFTRSGEINNNYPAPDIINFENGEAFLTFNVKTLASQPDATSVLSVIAGAAIKTIENSKLEASFLSEDNITPDPKEPENAVNRRFLETSTFNIKNSTVTGNNNIGFQSEIKDRGYYIGYDGMRNGTGWKTFERKGIAGETLTFSNFTITEGGYYSFRRPNGSYFGTSPIFRNEDIPLTLVYPEDGVLVIDVARPADIDTTSHLMVNMGPIALPYEPAIERYISNIGGYKIQASLGIPQEPYRKAAFSFVFDDGTASDENVVALFTSNDLRCGFALVTEWSGNPLSPANIARYLGYQSQGYEILSHSKSHTSMQTNITPANAEIEMKDSLDFLTNAGFDIKGWVTPMSQMRPDLIPILKKYYEYGYTEYFGESTPLNLNGYQKYWVDKREFNRVSLESTSIENIKLQIDKVIEQNGYCCFYGHAYPSATMPVEKITEVITYLKNKESSGLCNIGLPRDVINEYYKVDHESLINIIRA